jgi:hypothetical protein
MLKYKNIRANTTKSKTPHKSRVFSWRSACKITQTAVVPNTESVP